MSVGDTRRPMIRAGTPLPAKKNRHIGVVRPGGAVDRRNRSDAHLLGLFCGMQEPVLLGHHVDVAGAGRMKAAADLVLDRRDPVRP